MHLFFHSADIMKLDAFPSDNCSTAESLDFAKCGSKNDTRWPTGAGEDMLKKP